MDGLTKKYRGDLRPRGINPQPETGDARAATTTSARITCCSLLTSPMAKASKTPPWKSSNAKTCRRHKSDLLYLTLTGPYTGRASQWLPRSEHQGNHRRLPLHFS
jgi:hypothetical protein